MLIGMLLPCCEFDPLMRLCGCVCQTDRLKSSLTRLAGKGENGCSKKADILCDCVSSIRFCVSEFNEKE